MLKWCEYRTFDNSSIYIDAYVNNPILDDSLFKCVNKLCQNDITIMMAINQCSYTYDSIKILIVCMLALFMIYIIYKFTTFKIYILISHNIYEILYI